jgi:hypothetical protein
MYCHLNVHDTLLRLWRFLLNIQNEKRVCNNSYKPITNTAWVRARLCKLQKRVHSARSASDRVYQLLAHGRWFSPGTPASYQTNTLSCIFMCSSLKQQSESGADPGFQVRGSALKKNSAERREARQFLGYFVWKITILSQKIIFYLRWIFQNWSYEWNIETKECGRSWV